MKILAEVYCIETGTTSDSMPGSGNLPLQEGRALRISKVVILSKTMRFLVKYHSSEIPRTQPRRHSEDIALWD